MKVGIYFPWLTGAAGGAERTSAILAGALATEHVVELVHHAPTPVRDRLESVTGVDLSRVAERAVARLPTTPRRRPGTPGYWRARAVLDAPLSAPYDLFVALAHEPPPFCHARVGLLRILFPFVPSARSGRGTRRPRARWAASVTPCGCPITHGAGGGGWRATR